VLARLDQAAEPRQLDLPGWHCTRSRARRLLEHHGKRHWRIIFRFEQGDATDVDLLDYH
jgi:plasmid maintenance system killer protein